MNAESTKTYVFSLFLLFIFLYIIVNYIIKNRNNKEEKNIKYNEMEEMFFKEICNGKYIYKILEIYSPYDLMIIKSILISENIPYYNEFEHLMKVWPFVHSLNYNNSNLYILEEDYEDTIIIIKEYIENKNIKNYNIKGVFRNVLEYLIMTWVIPSPNDNLGFDVNYKKNKERKSGNVT